MYARENFAEYPARLGVERRIVLRELRVFEVYRPVGGESHRVAGEARGHHAVEHVGAEGYHFQKLRGRPDAHDVARLFARQARLRRFDLFEHLRLGLADAHPAYRVPGEVELREPAGAAGPYVGIAAALDYPEGEDAGLRKPQFVVLASAPLCPPQRPFDGLLHLPPFAGVGYALVQNHADVGAQIFLDSHARFGGDEELCAVEMRGERNPVLGDFAGASTG